MTEKLTGVALGAAILLAAVPALAAPRKMPQGKRDQMSMKDTKNQIVAQ